MLVFVSGGVRSGKSAWAETYALSLAAGYRSQLVYIAAARADDAEMRGRVALHKAARMGKGFDTLERYTNVGGVVSLLSPGCTVLLECLGTLLSNEMFGHGENETPGLAAPDLYVRKILDDILSLRARAAHVLVISNDIFSDGVTYDEPAERYRQALGALHVRLAGVASLAVECVAGQAVVHSGARKGMGFTAVPFSLTSK